MLLRAYVYLERCSFIHTTPKRLHTALLSVCLTREKVGTSHEGLPVDQTQGVHIHLLQRRLTVPQVHRPLQHLWGHVADRPHLADGAGIKRGCGG